MNDDEEQVIFEEGSPLSSSSLIKEKVTWFQDKLINLIMKRSGGLIKTEKQAMYVILGLVVLIFIVSIIVLIKSLTGFSITPPPEDVIPNKPENFVSPGF